MEKLTRQTLKALGLSVPELAKLLGVTDRAVNMWLSNSRSVPGPVLSYLRLFSQLPKAAQAQELARARQEDEHAKYEGIYSLNFQGDQSEGRGMLVLMAGRVFGSDEAGVSYDGLSNYLVAP
jgi:transcriptional regulator with XRE-family HTH domain